MQKPTAESMAQATATVMQKQTGMQPEKKEAFSAIMLDILCADYEKAIEDSHE